MLSDNLSEERRPFLMILDELELAPIVGKPCRSFDIDLFLDEYARIALRNHREYVKAIIRFNSFASEAQIG